MPTRSFEGSVDVGLPTASQVFLAIYFARSGGQLSRVFDLRPLSYPEHCSYYPNKKYICSYYYILLPNINLICEVTENNLIHSWFLAAYFGEDGEESNLVVTGHSINMLITFDQST